MATIPQIRTRLLEVFPEQQADVLAHVVIEAHEDLVTQADLHKLTGVVSDLGNFVSDLGNVASDLLESQRELADAQKRTDGHLVELADAQKRTDGHLAELAASQKRTELRVEELAESQGELADAQKRTEAHLVELADAQKRTDGHLAELADAQKRTDGHLVELADAQKRTDGHLAELAASQKRTELRVEELAESQGELADAQKRTEFALADLAKQVGGLANSLGGSLEDFACDLVPEILEKHWRLEVTSAEPEEIDAGRGHHEIDLVVRGTIDGRHVMVVCEVKSAVTSKEVTRFVRVIEWLRAAQPDRDIRCLFFGYRADRQAREAILAAGAAMVFTRGVIIPAA
jgi:DNA repair exonuclease SbcCD ATPase subunit